MNDMTPDRNERKANLKGLGTSRKRVEDARFTQGKGNYVDDIKLEVCYTVILLGRHTPMRG